MENNEYQDVALENNEEEIIEESDTEQPESEDTKVETDDETEALRKENAILKRKVNKLSKKDNPSKSEEDDSKKSSDFDYGEKAYLRSYDIKGSDELQLAKEWQKRTGDSLDTMVEDEIFQAKLTSLRKQKTVANAVPKGTRRSTQSGNNELDTAILEFKDSGKLPENFELRAQVLNKMVESDTSRKPF